MGVEKRTTRASKVNGGKATVNKVTTKVTTNKAATSKSIVLQVSNPHIFFVNLLTQDPEANYKDQQSLARR